MRSFPSWARLTCKDLTIVRRYGQGENSYRISQRLPGRAAKDIAGRYRQLVPTPGLAAQREALEAAERRMRGTPAAA